MRRVLSPLAAMLCCVGVGAPAASARTVPFGFYGTMADGVLLDRNDAQLRREFDVMRSNGVETIRPVVYWADMQATRGGPVDFSSTDRLFGAAASHGIAVMPVMLRAPGWARIDPGNFASPPKDPRDFAAFLRAMVGRYGPTGSFWTAHPEIPRRPQRAWEIWNEPNLDRYWSSPKSFAKPFVALMKSAHDGLKAADPGSEVVLAAMGNASWKALAQAYAAGLRPSMYDVVALHPFSGRLENVLKIVRLNREAMAANGDGAKHVVISELTWPSAQGKTKNTTGFETTEGGQATRLANSFRALTKLRRSQRIDGIVWSTWLTRDMGSANSFDWSGLRKLNPANPAGEPVTKPALRAFSAIALPAKSGR